VAHLGKLVFPSFVAAAADANADVNSANADVDALG
jgi:hypothetical protein